MHPLRTYSRRVFLRDGLAFASLCATAPAFIQRSALGMLAPQQARGERILVIVQLGGGNDGLNTVIPYGALDVQLAIEHHA